MSSVLYKPKFKLRTIEEKESTFETKDNVDVYK